MGHMDEPTRYDGKTLESLMNDDSNHTAPAPELEAVTYSGVFVEELLSGTGVKVVYSTDQPVGTVDWVDDDGITARVRLG